MSFDIRFSLQAQETFDAIVDQLKERWGDKIVKRFKDKVNKTLDVIAETPLIFPVAEENDELRKCVLHKNCSMYYLVYDDIVEILYFWDNRQDPLTF